MKSAEVKTTVVGGQNPGLYYRPVSSRGDKELGNHEKLPHRCMFSYYENKSLNLVNFCNNVKVLELLF